MAKGATDTPQPYESGVACHLFGERLEITPDGLPHLRVPRGYLSANGEIALGYLKLGYWPVPVIQDEHGMWVPAILWKPFQHRAPAREEIVEWWMRYPNAAIALVCGREAGLVILDVDPRHGGADPKLSAPSCSTPRDGIHYHFVAPASIPELHGPGLEWLRDGHIARVPPTPGYRWLNGRLPPRVVCYERQQLPRTQRPQRPSTPAPAAPKPGNLCRVLEGLGLNAQLFHIEVEEVYERISIRVRTSDYGSLLSADIQ